MGEWGPATSRPEWLLMYARGLSIRQIAALCRVDYEKVRLHIRSQERRNPTLFGRRLILHDRPTPAPAPPAQLRRTPWDTRFAQMQQFIDKHHRLPQQLSPDPAERQLHRWLARQRENYTHDRMNAEQAQRLDTLGSWRGTVLGDRETHWRHVHADLLQFIQDTGRMPNRGSENATAQEDTLDVWIQTQRARARTGKLSPNRRHILDDSIPGWNQTRASRRSD